MPCIKKKTKKPDNYKPLRLAQVRNAAKSSLPWGLSPLYDLATSAANEYPSKSRDYKFQVSCNAPSWKILLSTSAPQGQKKTTPVSALLNITQLVNLSTSFYPSDQTCSLKIPWDASTLYSSFQHLQWTRQAAIQKSVFCSHLPRLCPHEVIIP